MSDISDSELYNVELKQFERLFYAAMVVSYNSGGVEATANGIIATQIFTRLAICSRTLYSIYPRNTLNSNALWDMPSIANVTRMFIETCHKYFYMADSNISDSEQTFRRRLYHFHLNCEKYKLFKEHGNEHERIREFEQKLPVARNELVSFEEYKSLPKEMANRVRSGNADMCITHSEAATRVGLIANFSYVYRLLSVHSHGSPFATSSQSNERGRGFVNEVELLYFVMFLNDTVLYLAKTILVQIELLSIEKNCSEQKILSESLLDSQI